MQNYARILAKDKSDNHMQDFSVPFPAVRSSSIENATTSSVTALSSITTVLEIGAVTQGAAIKWTTQANLTATSSVITVAGTANFDNFIPAGTVRKFVVPRNTQSLSNASISGINVQEGLYNAVAIKTTGIGSVLLTEY